jgi:protein-arginine kinase activator protein McsA
MVTRLVEMRESLRTEYKIGKTLDERLAEAVATEQYELAAKLRDELNRRDAG